MSSDTYDDAGQPHAEPMSMTAPPAELTDTSFREIQQGQGKPQRGFAEYTWAKVGTYKGDWSGGLPHGSGTLYYNSGVRYSGSWHCGKPCGEGVWTREKPVPPAPKPPKVTTCKCTIPTGQVQRNLIEPVGYAVFLRPDWPPGVNPSDRKAFARHLACWWPGGNKELNAKISKSEFYKRVLLERSPRDPGVEIVAINELPLGSRGGAPPKIILEIWCKDDKSSRKEDATGMPVAVLHVRFNEDYSKTHSPGLKSVRCIHVSFCRLQENFGDSYTHTEGVHNCANLWEKVVEMEGEIGRLQTIEVRDGGWEWRDISRVTAHCFEKGMADEACWSPEQAQAPLTRGVGGAVEGCEHICDGCLAFAAVRRLLNDAHDTLWGQQPILSHGNMLVDGLCLPISIAEHAALASYQNNAMLFCFQSQPAALQQTGVSDFCEFLESLHWKTHVYETASKLVVQRAITSCISSVDFRRGANLFLFVGHTVRIGESTYILSDDVHITSSYLHNRIEWEEEIRANAFSLDWMQEQLAEVRVYGAPPSFIIVEGNLRSGDTSGHHYPTCKRRAHNSMMIRSFQDRYDSEVRRQDSPRNAAETVALTDRLQQIQTERDKLKSGSKFLALLQYMMVQRGMDVRDVLMRLNSDFEGGKSGCFISIDYDGLRQHFFHPKIGLETNYDVAPEHRRATVQSFRLPLVWGAPTEAISGRPDLMNRIIRLPSLAGSAQDCLAYLESRCQDTNFRDTKCLLHGDDGTGKTTMTCALVQRLYWQRCCEAFFWIRASNSTQFYNDCLMIAKYLGFTDDGEDRLEVLLARLRLWLTQNPRWFVVLEDAEDEAAVDLLDLPMQHGMLFVTSRPGHWTSVPWQNVVELGPLSHDEGVAFVHRMVKKQQPFQVDSLLKELHFHPLSVRLALSYIRTEKTKVDKFNSTRTPLDLSADTRHCAVGMTTKERVYLATVRSVIASTIKALSPTLQVMLVACACTHFSSIQRSIFADSKDCDKYFDTLLRYGCLEMGGDAVLHMNPLLQLAIREHFLDLRSAGLQHLCALLEKGMSYRDKEKVGIHVERAGWLVHVLEAHSLGGTFSFPFLVACADHLANKMHDYDQSLSLLRSLREQLSEGEIVTQLGGVTGLAGMQMTCRDDRTGKPVLESYPSRQLSAVLDHMVTEEADYPRILSIALHTGEVLMKREEFHEAQHQFDQFLGLFTDLGCQRDGVFARATCLVGDCLRAQGRYAEALNRYEEALHTCTQFTRATGVAESDWFPFFLRLRVRDEEQFHEIKQQFILDFARGTDLPLPLADGNDCVEIVRAAPNTLQSPFREVRSGKIIVELQVRSDLDYLVHDQAKEQRSYKSPLHFVQECARLVSDPTSWLNQQARTTGLIDDVSCPSLEGGQDRVILFQADLTCKVGDVLSDLGNHELAEAKYIMALHSQRTLFDSDEACIANTLHKIGEARSRQRKFDKAFEVAEECRAMRSRLVGFEDCSLAEAYELCGSVCDGKGRYQEALKSFDTARRIYRARCGPTSAEVARASIGVGVAQDQLGQWELAKAELSAALGIYQERRDIASAARCLNNLAIVHRKQGAHQESLALLEKAKGILSDNFGMDHFEFVGLVRNTGSVYFAMQKWKEAQEQWEMALKMISPCEPHTPGESIETALTMLNIGSVHLKMARYREAHEMYGRVYAQLVRLLGKEHVDTARALVGLGTSSEKLGDLEKSRERLKRALTVMRTALGMSHVEVSDVELNLATVLLRQATAAKVVQDQLRQWQPEPQDNNFPMSAAVRVRLSGNQVEKLQDNVELQNEFSLHLARSVADMDLLGKVGARLMRDAEGQIVVEEVVRGGPADIAGLLTGDILDQIDGRSTPTTVDAAESKLNGAIDSSVQVRVKRKLNSETGSVSISITRKESKVMKAPSAQDDSQRLPSASFEIMEVLPEHNEVLIRIYRGVAGAATPAQLVQCLISRSQDMSSKLICCRTCDACRHIAKHPNPVSDARKTAQVVPVSDANAAHRERVLSSDVYTVPGYANKCRWGSKISKVSSLSDSDQVASTLHEALCLYQHVVQVRTAKYGPADVDIAHALRCIGDIHMVSATSGIKADLRPTGDVEEERRRLAMRTYDGDDRKAAVSEYWKALRIFEITLGREHDDAVSTCEKIEAALQEEVLLVSKHKDSIQFALDASRKPSVIRSKHQEAIDRNNEVELTKATEYLETVKRKLQDCQKWKDPNPFSYSPPQHKMQRTKRFQLTGNEFGPENRGKYGTVQDGLHDGTRVSFLLDSAKASQEVSTFDFEKNACYVLPEGLEAGRKVVISGLTAHTKYNGVHGTIKAAHNSDPERVHVLTSIDSEDLEVRFENCEFQLPEGYRQGLRVKLISLSAANDSYNGGHATIVRAFELDPSRILVRLDNGGRIFALKPQNMEVVLPKGFALDCRVLVHGLQTSTRVNGRFGRVLRPESNEDLSNEDIKAGCRRDPDRIIVMLDPVGDQKEGSQVSIHKSNLRFALPVGLHQGRQVEFNRFGAVVKRADEFDSSLVVIALDNDVGSNKSTQTGRHEVLDKEQSVPLHELVIQLAPGWSSGMSVQVRDLKKDTSKNGKHGRILRSSPYDPDRVVVELESVNQDNEREVVEVRYSNVTAVGREHTDGQGD